MLNLNTFSLKKLLQLYSFPSCINEINSILTNNITYKRTVFSLIGYFNENLISNEDAELNYRLRKFGEKIFFDPRIIVGHFHRSSLKSYIMQSFEYGRGLFQWGDGGGIRNNSIISLNIRKKNLFLLALLVYPVYILVKFIKLQDSLVLIPIFIVREMSIFSGYCYEKYIIKSK